MFNSDAVAYIPLIAVAIICAAMIIFLGITRTRKTAKVSSLTFLSLLILIIACIYTTMHPGMMKFVLMVLVAAAVILPYVIMLAFGKEKQESHLEFIQEEIKKPETIIEEIKPDQISLLERGGAFVTLAADGFGNKEGMQTLLDCINKTCIDVAKADGGAILMVDDFEDSINVKSFIGDFPPPYELPAEMPHKPLRVSTSFKFAAYKW